jgi:hypothetical protein
MMTDRESEPVPGQSSTEASDATSSHFGWADALRSLSLGGRVCALTAVMVFLYAAVSPLAYWRDGITGLAAAAIPAALCLVDAIVALVLSGCFRGPLRALYGLLVSMAVRLTPPLLLLALVMSFRDGPLARAWIVYYLVLFYLAALGIEVPLSLAGAEPPHHAVGAKGPVS